MDNFSIHLGPLPRLHSHPARVETIGYVSRKTCWVDHVFSSFNFSLILSGSGQYYTKEGIWPVEAPCVITQWPGIHAKYGPEERWEELYIIFPAECVSVFRASGFADPDRPAWDIPNPLPVRQRISRLIELLKVPQEYGNADRVDVLCWEVVLETLLGQYQQDRSEQAGVRAIKSYIEQHFTESIDFDHLAAQHGLTPATFRRHWAKVVSVPPGQYATQLRMQQACRMLVETEMPVSEIAAKVGYDDPFYFSRRFSKTINMSASEYRLKNSIMRPSQGL